MFQSVVTIYENYLENMNKDASNETRRLGGLSRLFTGKQSGAEALTTAFDAAIETELNQMLENPISSAEIRRLADWMQEQVTANRDEPKLKYAFMAVQRHILPLVGGLSRDDAAYLMQKLESAIPKRERFPVHQQLIGKLRERSRTA